MNPCGVGFIVVKCVVQNPILIQRGTAVCRRGVGQQQQPGIVIPQRVQQAVVNAAVSEMAGALGKQFKFH